MNECNGMPDASQSSQSLTSRESSGLRAYNLEMLLVNNFFSPRTENG